MKLILICLITSISVWASALEVTVSILPQKYFVKKIAQNKVDVNVMVKKGFSPATYEPKTSQMRKLSHSKVYFSIGVPFENSWLEKFEAANSKMLIVDTSKGIDKLAMQAHHHEEEKHDDHDEHDDHKDHKEHAKHDDHDKHEDHKKHDDHDEHDDHAKHTDHDAHEKHEDHDEHDEHKEDAHHHEGGLDPHVWLDPILVKTQAKNILQTLVSIDSKNKSFYEANYASFILELDALNKNIQAILANTKDKAFMVFHPSWGYFAKRYDLEQIAVEKEGKEPKPKELSNLIEEAKLHNIKIVFVAPQFSQKAAKIIAKSIGGVAVHLDPLSEDYAKNLLEIAKVIQNSYK